MYLQRYLKSLRALKGVNQEPVAKHLGLSQNSFSKKENGKIPFSVEELKLLADYFDVPIANFFENEVVRMKTN